MFKEVVVVYRTAGTGRAKGRSSDALNPRTAKERLADMLQQRNIHIKFFHDIPMADIEAIFPGKLRLPVAVGHASTPPPLLV